MKNFLLSILCFFCLSNINAQSLIAVPEITPEQEKEVLYNHVIAYFATGITFAKAEGTSAKEYGEYIGNQFKVFWNPTDGFAFFANQIMFILKGVNPYSDMQIVEQNDKVIRFKMKNIGMLFQNGNMYGISFNDFLEASDGILTTLANYMNTKFSYQMIDNNTWYEVTLQAK
ncbi:hypothetical protein ACUNWD_18640 [Sunxiuqinia sp. A32]|uniref:hypothetical protein n=1 Tax=Sunxiuqinia sp. A32 TaxID=3461496 RepID=UPI004045F372